VTLDMRLEKYRRNGGGWLAGRVDVRVDGRTVELAEIGSARYNLGFPEWTWDPERWRLGVAVNPYSRGDHVGLDFPNPGLWGH
jgi:hypothetical protein